MHPFVGMRYPEDPQRWLLQAVRDAPVEGLPPDVATISRESGVSRHTLYRMVAGERVAPETVAKVAKALKVPGPGELRGTGLGPELSPVELIQAALSVLGQAERSLSEAGGQGVQARPATASAADHLAAAELAEQAKAAERVARQPGRGAGSGKRG